MRFTKTEVLDAAKDVKTAGFGSDGTHAVREKKKKVHTFCANGCLDPNDHERVPFTGLEDCKQCGHHTYCPLCGNCNIHGEVRSGSAKKEPTREFHCSAEFYPKKGSYCWHGELVVKAFSLMGAVRKGTYELKKKHVPARKQLRGCKVVCTPMAGRKG